MEFRCAIAAPHELAIEAGERAVREGGNAVDAVLAAAVTLTVAYPHMCSIGGDMFALVASPEGEVTAIDASGPAAGLTDAGALAATHGSMPITGPDTITVPGVLAGWEKLASYGSTGGLPGSVREAARLARDGVPVSPSLSRAILNHRSALSEDPGMAAVFHPSDRPLEQGDTLIQPALARTLEEIASSGTGAFYEGAVGESFLRGLHSLGSRLRADDLARYRCEESAPITTRFGELEVMTSPPATQGLIFLEILHAISRLDGGMLGDRADQLARVFYLASRDRDRHLADPRLTEVPVGRLLSAEHAELLADQARTGGDLEPASSGPRPTGDTVAVAAVDSEGRAVSLIQSVFHAFGSGLLEPRTGIICHNRGACFSLDPESPNRIAPWKRPAHTLMPVLLRDGSGRVSAHGTMGGRAQPQIHTQLLLRRLAGSDPHSAVSAPRFVVGGLDAGSESDVIFAENDLPAETVTALAGTGFEIRTEGILDEIVGHTMMAVNSGSGLAAASDPRSDGAARVVERGS